MMKRLASLRLVVVHDRNVVDDERVEFVRDPQIVGGAERLLAQIVRRKSAPRPSPPAARAARGPCTTSSQRRAAVPAGQPPPGIVERGARRPRRPARTRPAGRRASPAGSRCALRAAPRRMCCSQHGDERQEQRAVEPVLVELGRRHIRGRDHDHAELEQPREQPAEDHGVGDVGDVEFVEAEQPGFVGDLLGGEPDRIVVGDLAVLRSSGGRHACVRARRP